MPNTNPIYVIGHKNPDTDSICSAICYSEFKKKLTGENYIPKRCGNISSETQFVLDYFNFTAPEFVDNVYTQVKDVEYRHIKGVSGELSIKKAWEILYSSDLSTLFIVNKQNYLTGVITISDIAKSYMEVYDNYIISDARTPYSNIIDTLNGELIVGNPKSLVKEGKVLIAAANPDLMESIIEPKDIVILGNRYESQLCAIEMEAQAIIICDGAPVSKTIQSIAASRNCTIIQTFYDTYTCARLINQSIPIRHFMKRDNIITFHVDDYIKDLRPIMSKKRHQYYPVLNEADKCIGLISQRNLLDAIPKKVILVDHNERSQTVDGIDEVNLLEIIDHHRLGGLQTMNPVFFRNMPLGCTATIIYSIYKENGIKVPKNIAGLLAAAIISDTLMFRSPTCTAYDKTCCEELSKIAGIEIEQFATKMFKAGSKLHEKSESELFYQDFKLFSAEDAKFGISQVTAFNEDALLEAQPRMTEYLNSIFKSLAVNFAFIMLTNIISETTTLVFCSKKDDIEELLIKAFGSTPVINSSNDIISGYVTLPSVVSRKKQVVPSLISAIKNEV